jgi:uncharacterized protein
MSDELVGAVKLYLHRSVPEFQTDHLAWFGGEPLIHDSLVADVTQTFRSIQSACQSNGTVSVTTNGWYLKPKVAKRLDDAGVDIYQITLDGPEGIHDSQRVLSNGAPTYSRILENIDDLLSATGAHVMIRINVDTDDSSSTATIGAWLREDLFGRFADYRDRVQFNVVPIWTADTHHIEGICLTELHKYQVWKSVLDFKLQWEGRSSAQYLANVLSEVGHLACYAGKPDNYVIGSDGAIYKCTVAFDRPENAIGRLGYDGDLILDAEKELLWTSANATTDPICSACAFSLSCQGLFCPLLRMQTNSQPCPTEKRFYADLLMPRSDKEFGESDDVVINMRNRRRIPIIYAQ